MVYMALDERGFVLRHEERILFTPYPRYKFCLLEGIELIAEAFQVINDLVTGRFDKQNRLTGPYLLLATHYDLEFITLDINLDKERIYVHLVEPIDLAFEFS